MKYQFAYVGASENAQTIIQGVADNFYNEDITVTDISQDELEVDADIYIFGFEITKGNIPVCVMEAFEELDGKIIICIIPCTFVPNDSHIEEAENKIEPFLPDDCDYRGTYLCMGQVSYDVYSKARDILESEPDHQKANQIVEFYKKSEGHPNEEDINKAIAFINNKIF